MGCERRPEGCRLELRTVLGRERVRFASLRAAESAGACGEQRAFDARLALGKQGVTPGVAERIAKMGEGVHRALELCRDDEEREDESEDG